jgi:hypothetical protein
VNWGKHFVYWIAPSLAISVLVAMYFSNVRWLMTIVAPEVNRELGLLEGLQNLVLLLIIGLTVRRAYHSDAALERGLFLAFVAGSLFMLLEELEYGTHYWWLIQGWDMDARPTVSIHNYQGDRYLDWYKKGGDALMAVWFVIFPWVAARSRNRWLRFLRPSRSFILPLIAAVLLSDVAHYLSDNFPPTPNYLDATIGEFRELFTYYIWLLYLGTLTRLRTWPDDGAGGKDRGADG